MTEFEKIAYAKSFIDKLANGINPLDDTLLPEGDAVNDIRIARCFFYVSSLLQRELSRLVSAEDTVSAEKTAEKKPANTATPAPKKNRKRNGERVPFAVDEERVCSFVCAPYPISATVLAKKINRLAAEDEEGRTMMKFRRKQIVQYLINIGMIEWVVWENGRLKCIPTEEGEKIGLHEGRWGSAGREVPIIYYDENAQQFVIDHLDAILATRVEKNFYD